MPVEPALGRRAIAAGLLAAALPLRHARAASLPVPPSNRLTFRVMRKGSDIGSHALVFVARPGMLVITSAVSIAIRLGPIALFRYTHHVTETWATPDGQPATLASGEAKTDDDGTRHFMRAKASAAGLVVDGSDGGHYVAPAGTLLATHWNRAELDRPMVNPQGGKLLSPTVTPFPPAPLALANGTSVPARRYALTGDTVLDLYYDTANLWAGIGFVARDGSAVTYQRV